MEEEKKKKMEKKKKEKHCYIPIYYDDSTLHYSVIALSSKYIAKCFLIE